MDFIKYLFQKEGLRKNFSFISNEKGMTLAEVIFAMTFSFILLAAILTVYNTNHFILFSNINKISIAKDFEHINTYLSSETSEEVSITIIDNGKHLTITNSDTLELIFDASNLTLHFNGVEKFHLPDVSDFSASIDNNSLHVSFLYKEMRFKNRYTLLDERFNEDRLNDYREG